MLRDLELESRSEGQSLSNRESCKEHVILHDIGGVVRESVRVQLVLVVEHDVTRHGHPRLHRDSIREQVE